MKKTIIIILILTLCCPMLALAFTKGQHKVLNYAKFEGSKINYPLTMQAIAMQESLAGVLPDEAYKGKSYASYGACGMQLVTAKYILKDIIKVNLGLTDKQLVYKLINDDEFNIKLATAYFKYLTMRFKSWKLAVLAYNVGPTKVTRLGLAYDPQNYVRNIQLKMRLILDQEKKH